MIYKDTQAAIAARLHSLQREYSDLGSIDLEFIASEVAAAVVPGFLEQLGAARRIIEHRRDSDSEVAG